MAGKRCKRIVGQHSDSRIRAYPVMEYLPGLGLGNRRQRAGAWIPEAVWIGDGFEWSHTPDSAKGGRKRYIPYGTINCISTTCAWNGARAGTDQGRAGGQVAKRAGV